VKGEKGTFGILAPGESLILKGTFVLGVKIWCKGFWGEKSITNGPIAEGTTIAGGTMVKQEMEKKGHFVGARWVRCEQRQRPQEAGREAGEEGVRHSDTMSRGGAETSQRKRVWHHVES